MIEFYKVKGISDFKNSKKFWNFYKNSIKIKSDTSSYQNHPTSIFHDGQLFTSPDEISNMFNTFFTSIKSESSIHIDEASRQILLHFQKLNKTKALNFSDKFTLNPLKLSNVQYLIGQVSTRSSPGHIGLHPKVL